MGSYYPISSAEIDVLSSTYSRDKKLASYPESNNVDGNMMMYPNPISCNAKFSDISSASSMNSHNEMMIFIPPTTVMGNSIPRELQFTARNDLNMIETDQTFQGLSLSLNTQMYTPVSTPSFQFQYSNPGLSSYDIHGNDDNIIRFGFPNTTNINNNNNNSQVLMIPKGVNCNPYDEYEQRGITNAPLKSKFLKAAQQLLDEIVNVRDTIKRRESGNQHMPRRVEECSKESPSEAYESGVSVQELSSAEQQELQNKVAKLHSMLDEVDKRYKEYSHQMQMLCSSLDMVTGIGGAKPYTSLALKTISRHFRSLLDAITEQIQATRRSLGESDDGMGGGPIPRLRYVDQQLRQQRALQHFGIMRHAWRPQRGLPETAVTILRAWLFEHFLHPYPKDSEKIMLARQAGLTRSQVANWFINARVRLWKPMVEEMYKEEFGEAKINCSEDNNKIHKLAKEKSWGTEEDEKVTCNTESTMDVGASEYHQYMDQVKQQHSRYMN